MPGEEEYGHEHEQSLDKEDIQLDNISGDAADALNQDFRNDDG